MTLLAGQVQGAEAGFALCIHLALVVKQRLGNVDLFLLGGSVNGRVAVLGHGVGRCALSSSMARFWLS